MSDKLVLKPEYDDALLDGAIEGAYITQRYQTMIRNDGASCQDFVARQEANDLAKMKDADGIVAGGIATAILDSVIIYGKVGEQFLKEKMQEKGEDFSQEEYAKDIARMIVINYPRQERKQKIVDGVVAAFNDDPNNIEANAAKAGIIKAELFSETRFSDADIVEEKFLNGTVIKNDAVYSRLNEIHHQKISEEKALSNLNTVYDYFNNHYERISDRYKGSYAGFSKSKIIGYFIANLHDDEMQEVLKVAKEETNREER